MIYIPIKSWWHHFDTLCVSINFPDTWSGRIVSGEWKEENSGGRVYNDQYHLNPKYKLIIPTDHTQIYIQCIYLLLFNSITTFYSSNLSSSIPYLSNIIFI